MSLPACRLFSQAPHGQRVPRTRGILRVLVPVLLSAAPIWVVTRELWAHDLFLKPEAFFVAPHSQVRVWVLNGTFTASEAAVDRDRLRDLSVVSTVGVVHPDTATWERGDKKSSWHVAVADSGTYAIAASVRPRILRLEGKAFNQYLKEDGIPDILELRRRRGEMNSAARERYSKHVKALVLVGGRGAVGDSAFSVQLGYPAELVPLDNPYGMKRGQGLRVRALVDGKPVVGQLVLAGGHSASGEKFPEVRMRTDSQGVARLALRRTGVWYVKFVNMREVAAGSDSVNYESKWATLSFALR